MGGLTGRPAGRPGKGIPSSPYAPPRPAPERNRDRQRAFVRFLRLKAGLNPREASPDDGRDPALGPKNFVPARN